MAAMFGIGGSIAGNADVQGVSGDEKISAVSGRITDFGCFECAMCLVFSVLERKVAQNIEILYIFLLNFN
jgi:hypothetical protein